MVDISNAIGKAIDDKKELKLKVQYGLGDGTVNIPFQPYILGSDILQYDFVWGYLSYNMNFYKIPLEKILSAEFTGISFTCSSEACYQYSIEEEHYRRLEGFQNIFSGPARLVNQ